MGQRKSKANNSYDVTTERNLKNEKLQNGEPSKNVNGGNKKPSAAAVNQQNDTEKTFDPKLIPSWIREEIFIEALKENFPDFERIANFKAFPALNAGENYATLMLRINIDVELKDKSTQNVSFMLKVPHDNEQMKQMLALNNFFFIENGMYLDILPELHQMYKNAGHDVTIAPKAYKLNVEGGKDSVLLQDLKPLGYKNADRLECLDLTHAKRVLQKLAQYHAASATRVATQGPYEDAFMNGLIKDMKIMEAMWGSVMNSFHESFLKNIKTFKDGDKYEPHIRKYFENSMQEFRNFLFYKENEFNVLSHGDCWANNILFKYNEAGEIDDVVFVDFQMSKYGAAAQDLLYFLFTSLQIDIKLKHFDYLIRYYYDNLIENLQLLKYPKVLPTLRNLHIQIFKYGVFAVSAVIITLPVVLLDPTDLASSENFMSASDDGMAFKNSLYQNKRYHTHINKILPWLFNRGLLEVGSAPEDNNNLIDNPPVTKSSPSAATSHPKEPPAQPPNPIPSWITESVFLDMLKENFKGFKSIKNFNSKVATSSGDNYSSILLQIDISLELDDGSIKNPSYMLKVGSDNEQTKMMLESLNTFNKEIALYNEYIPKFEEMFKKVGQDVVFGPKSYDLPQKSDKNVVLLDNLRTQGFANFDRLKCLDEEHSKAVLRKLAQYHAASATYAMEHKYPEFLRRGVFVPENRAFFEQIGDAMFEIAYECFKEYKGSEEYIHKLKDSKKTYFDVMLKTAAFDENDFNVLNHGDVWTNNIMFKHDESGNILETYFIDFQIAQYGSPAHDLYYFLMSSTTLDVKLEKFDEMIHYYHQHLVENLKLFNYPKRIPTLKEFHQHMLEKIAYGYSAVSGIMSIVLLKPTEMANMENMMSNEDAGIALKKQMYTNPLYKSHAEPMFLWLNQRGALDLK